MAVAWTRDNAAHLLRRATFGAPSGEIDKFFDRHVSIDDAVDDLLSFKPSKRKPPAVKDNGNEDKLKIQRWWTKQMARQRKPAKACLEKLVLFWHSHLVSGGNVLNKFGWMSYQQQLFRLNAGGNFRFLVREFNRDPANMYYLDGIKNKASDDGVHVSANENFGRELMELFTLGVFELADDGSPDTQKPTYTEDDVHGMARALTGWTKTDKIDGTYKGVFKNNHWDGGQYDDDGDDLPDPMVIFGQVSNGFKIGEEVAGTSDDVLELIFSRTDDVGNNQVAMFLTSRLWNFYAYPPPGPSLKALLAGFAAEFANSDFEIKPLLKAIWTSDEFYSDRARTRRVKSPVDFVIGAMRSLNAKGDGREIGDSPEEMGELMAEMGMDLFFPPNVAGWPSGLGWINSGTLLQRFNFARYLASASRGPARLKLKRIKALPWKDPVADPGVVLDALMYELGLDSGPLALTTGQRDSLIDYLTDSGAQATLDLSTDDTDDVNTKVRGVLSLLLQTAEYQVG